MGLLKGFIKCEAPNDKVNDFNAQLNLLGSEPSVLTADNVVLRGCQVRARVGVGVPPFRAGLS